MKRSRPRSFAWGCLAAFSIATFCTGGAHGEGGVSMPDVVDVEVGKTALIPCQFSLPENGSYAYINWFSLDKMKRKMIISMIRDKERNNDSRLKERLSITSDFSLEIRKVVLQDANVYICQVGFGVLGVAENRTRLRVYKAPEPPVIHTTETGIMASDFERYEIAKCISRNGYPVSTITWYKDEEPLTENGKDIEIRPMVIVESSGLFTVQSILLAQVNKEDRHALFHCQVDYNLMGVNETAVSRNFTINIHYPSEEISFVMETPNPVVKEGDNVSLHCKADGNPPPEYTLAKLQDGKEEVLEDSSTGKVTLRNVNRSWSGAYLCRALDLQSFAELNASVNLFVNYLDVPTITVTAISVEQHERRHPWEGDTVFLTCNATSSKPVEFQWEKKGKPITKENPLILTKVTYMDIGEYTCHVTMPDVPGLSRLKAASIVVHSKPKLITPKEVVFVQEGELVNLTCSVFSVTKPKFSWSARNGTSRLSSRNHQHSSILLIQVTEALLASGINCSVENKLGRVEHHFALAPRSEVTESGPDKIGLSSFPPIPTPPGSSPDVFLTPTIPGPSPDVFFPNFTWSGNDTSWYGYNQTTPPRSPGEGEEEPKRPESKGVIIVAVIICIMVISILGAVLYFLHKKGKLPCGRSGKQEITRPDAHKDKIVVEVKSDKPEEAGLLQGANGEKKPTGDQGEEYINLRN